MCIQTTTWPYHVQVQLNVSKNSSWREQSRTRMEIAKPSFQIVIQLVDMKECSVTVQLENAGV